MPSLRIGVDVGGTFTDLCLFDDQTGAVAVIKVPSTPNDPAQGILDGRCSHRWRWRRQHCLDRSRWPAQGGTAERGCRARSGLLWPRG
jgi:N-methylhydantoinase A/oxoprolinase/acetone carboxylase beta subunit